MMPDAAQLYAVTEATWPPAARSTCGPFIIRDGQGGGKRVSAATVEGAFDAADIDRAEDAMRQLGQDPLFMIRQDDTALDQALDARGYDVVDPVVLYVLPIEKLTDKPIPRVTAFTIWEPLAIMREMWAQGGVGPARIEVMSRANTKTAILARWDEKPGGVAYAGLHEGTCMVHAVEVPVHQRRKGVAQWIMRCAAFWGQSQGATHVAVLCVTANVGANALYRSLGFTPVGGYHYRHLSE